MRCERGTLARLLRFEGRPVVVRVRQGPSRVLVRSEALDPARLEAFSPPPFAGQGPQRPRGEVEPARRFDLERAIERIRFALSLDEDLSDFYDAFRSDPLIGPAIRRRPWVRPRRRPLAWEALAWAITEQLIEVGEAAAIQRRIVRRWGPRWGPYADLPDPAVLAGRAPAELTALGLAASRSQALIEVAREVASGRVEPGDPGADARLARIRGIGPWTLQCTALGGRGDADALPAGDLAYLKLVGRLAGLGRRATVAEVSELFAPYAPYRGLAGAFALAHYHSGVAAGPPLRLAA